MTALGRHVVLSLRLYFRNRMALVYGYLFPIIFLIAFWVLYRHDRVPLIGHLGELLTVTILGGACFGLPTTLVSERERGVWRRYRLAPVSTATLIAGTLAARYVAVVGAGVVQVALAMALGMPLPAHWLTLLLPFTVVAFAFLGLGLVIAALADTVPAVQALGQCIFLPMLILGGVAVKLSSLPDWALHVSAFFPGRYAVQALQSHATGDGLSGQGFSLIALVAIGAAGMTTGAMLFRWDAHQHFLASGGKAWLTLAIGAWIGIGAIAELRGHVAVAAPAPAAAPAGSSLPYTARPRKESRDETGATTALRCPAATRSWKDVTAEMIDSEQLFAGELPSDLGLVTPIAPDGSQPDTWLAVEVERFTGALADWGPARASDPVLRVWNLLFVAGELDVDQLALEQWAPRIVFERMQREVPQERLVKILYWIACHPDSLPVPMHDDLRALGLPGAQGNFAETRYRASVYALKLLRRLTGKNR